MMDAFQNFLRESGDILQIDCATTSSKPLETDTHLSVTVGRMFNRSSHSDIGRQQTPNRELACLEVAWPVSHFQKLQWPCPSAEGLSDSSKSPPRLLATRKAANALAHRY